MEWRTFLIIKGLKTLSSKCPLHCFHRRSQLHQRLHPRGYLLTHDLIAAYSERLTLSRIDFSWHYRGAWLVLANGTEISHMPKWPKLAASWTRSEELDIIGNFHEWYSDGANWVLSAPLRWIKASLVANDSNLFGHCNKLYPVSCLRVSATALSKPMKVIRLVPKIFATFATAVPPWAISSTSGIAALNFGHMLLIRNQESMG